MDRYSYYAWLGCVSNSFSPYSPDLTDCSYSSSIRVSINSWLPQYFYSNYVLLKALLGYK